MSFIFLSQIVDRVLTAILMNFSRNSVLSRTLTVFPFGQIFGCLFNFFLHQVQVVDQLLFFIFPAVRQKLPDSGPRRFKPVQPPTRPAYAAGDTLLPLAFFAKCAYILLFSVCIFRE